MSRRLLGWALALILVSGAGRTSLTRADQPTQTEGGKMRLELKPGTWINSEPLTLAGLRGKVVLVDFWDYTCVNCLRTLPYLKAWYQRYHQYGLEIVGVHAPEFDFEKDPARVRAATVRLGITWPVLLDNDYQTWAEFGNHYWPHHYLFDATGKLAYDHIGEGGYDHTEAAIQKLLRVAGVTADLPAIMAPVEPTDRPGAVCYRLTPETYLGYERGQVGNPGGLTEDQPANYTFPMTMAPDTYSLDGQWQAGPESVKVVDGEGHALSLAYSATSVNLVLKPPAEGPGRLVLTLDGAPLPAADAGADAKINDQGQAQVTVDAGRMYELVKSPAWGQHTLKISFETAGTEAFAFTFGSSCQEPEE